MSRKNWDQYFIEIAKQISTRSTCNRLHVGAVIVKNKAILSTGYNGSISKLDHCDDVGHLMIDNHCVRTIHAESNAICQAAKNGICIDGASIYITHSPCLNCFKLCASAGIKKIIFDKLYKDDLVESFANQAKIELVNLDKLTTYTTKIKELPSTVLASAGPLEEEIFDNDIQSYVILSTVI